MAVKRRAKEGAAKRPAGTTASLTSLLVLTLGWFGVDLSGQDATILIGGLTTLSSMIFTR